MNVDWIVCTVFCSNGILCGYGNVCVSVELDVCMNESLVLGSVN